MNGWISLEQLFQLHVFLVMPSLQLGRRKHLVSPAAATYKSYHLSVKLLQVHLYTTVLINIKEKKEI